MAAILFFLAGVAGIAGWWLVQQRLAAKPWLEESPAGDAPASGASPLPAAKIGLGVFLAAAGSLFALSVSAYFMRMHMSDWRMLPDPPILWLNTLVLIVSSLALERARWAAADGQGAAVRPALLVAAAAAAAFLVGQALACRELAASGAYLASNPAASFFYLLTALHGLHLFGGLVALTRTIVKVGRGGDAERLRLSVDLCATYWHFLLLVWLVLFGLLMAT